MGTSKTKKNRQNTSGKVVAAKRRRRADRKAKSSQTLDLRGLTLPVPVWEYPVLVDAMTEQDPTLLTYEALVFLLNRPIYVSKDGTAPVALTPIEEIMAKGSTMEAFIGGFEDMHQNGILEWNPATLVHHMNSELAALEPQ